MSDRVRELHESAIRRLKINIKSLAAEARFNRMEKSKTRVPWIKCELDSHRTGKLRQEARVAQLAYAFVRGVPYKVVEGRARFEADWQRRDLANRVVAKLKNAARCREDNSVILSWMEGRKVQAA